MIPRVSHEWLGDGFPYEVLEGTRISPQSTHFEILEASLELQASQAMSPGLRRAWDQVRTPGERLVVDFFLYNAALSKPDDLVDRELRRLRNSSNEARP